jgi:hypothetical protein
MSEKPVSLSPDEDLMQTQIRLESIFQPHIRNIRDKAFGYKLGMPMTAVPPCRFVHYTSAEAALKIISTKRLWMRNTNCMSDYREVQHGFDILLKFFSDKENREAFVRDLDLCHAGVGMESLNLFDKFWPIIRFHTYVSSLSEHDSSEDIHGRLSMWRAFSPTTARVAVIFKVPWFSPGVTSLNLLVSPVAYLTESETHTILRSVIQQIRKNCNFLKLLSRQQVIAGVVNMLLTSVLCQKHEGFREEREWRAIYSPKLTPSPLLESSIEAIGGVPQVLYKIPLDQTVSPLLAGIDLSNIFDRIIIGPTAFPSVIAEAFQESLFRAGVTDVQNKVFASTIPIRS